MKDYEYFKNLIENGCCWSCKTKFTYEVKPTLDRIDNKLAHTKENVRLACLYCNRFCADLDSNMRSFFIQLKRYALVNNLTFTVADEDDKKHMFAAINGGLSTVHHRMNIADKNTITKLNYDQFNDSINIINTANKITHFIGVDFNSLYPSSFASVENKNNPYTDHKMYMPGKMTSSMTIHNENQLKRALKIINSKNTLFIALIKGYIPEECRNKCINFLPIIRNINVEKSEDIIGEYMYNYMSNHNYKLDNSEKKLTQTFCTYPISEYEFKQKNFIKNIHHQHKYNYIHGQIHNLDQYPDLKEELDNINLEINTNGIPINKDKESGYMYFSSYYLWFLMDNFNFIIEDVEWIATFSKHDKFNYFVNDCMERRQNAKLNKDKVGDLHFKNMMNSSYGYDGMRTDKYDKISFVEAITDSDLNKVYDAHRDPYHVDTLRVSADNYIIVKKTKKYAVSTPIQCAVFTLDNAKFWYLNFIYNFMEKCLDMNKIHFVEGDTDSQYWAVSGNTNDGYDQGFKHVIKDHQFYNEHVFEWLPYDFYCSDESFRPKLETSVEKMAHEKKLLGCAIEKQGLNIVSLGPKCYTTWGTNENPSKQISLKVKGVNMKIKTNKERLNYNTYVNVIENQDLIHGVNYMLQFKKIVNGEEISWKTCRVTMNKIALTGVHIKMKVHDDQCQTCTPLYIPCNVSINNIYTECDLQNVALNDEYKQYILRLQNLKENEKFDEHAELVDELNSKYKFACDATNFDYGYVFDVHTYFVKNPHISYYGSEVYNENIPDCLKNPCKKFNKFSKGEHVDVNNDEHKLVTGCVLDVSKSAVVVVDFDMDKSLTPEQKLELRQNIIDHYQLKTGLVSTTSNGLHAYFKADQIPYWYNFTSKRVIDTFQKELNGMKFSIDIMIPNDKRNPVVWAGTRAKNHDDKVKSYNKFNDWTFNDLEYYSDFDKRFKSIEGKYIINEVPFKRIVNPNLNFTRKVINNNVDKSKLDQLLSKFKYGKIHRFKKISAFSIMCCIASFDDDTYKYCLNYFDENKCRTDNAIEKFKTFDLNEFREKHPCHNPMKSLETLSKKC